jgi:hypothetical protein
MSTRTVVQASLLAALAAFYAATASVALHPLVSQHYRDYYIDLTTKDWRIDRRTAIKLIPCSFAPATARPGVASLSAPRARRLRLWHHARIDFAHRVYQGGSRCRSTSPRSPSSPGSSSAR